MKNSPDYDWLNKLSKRLADYSEEPDEVVWNNVFRAVNHQTPPYWLRWANRAEEVTCVVLLIGSLLIWANAPTAVDHQPVEQQILSEENESVEMTEEIPGQAEMQRPAFGVNKQATSTKGNQAIAANENHRKIWNGPRTTTSFSIFRDEMKVVPVIKQMIPAGFLQASTHSKVSSEKFHKKEAILPTRKKLPIIFYGSVSPSLSFQKIKPFHNDGVSVESFLAESVLSEDRLGLSVAGGIQWKLARRLEIYSGVSLYGQSQTLAYQYVSAEHATVAQHAEFDYRVVPGRTLKTINYSMLNVGAEAGFMYDLKGDRLAHKIGAGISWHHGVRQMRHSESYDNAKSQYLFYELFYRNEYLLNDHMNVFLQPFYKHVLVSFEAMNEPFTLKPYHAGLSFGITYRVR